MHGTDLAVRIRTLFFFLFFFFVVFTMCTPLDLHIYVTIWFVYNLLTVDYINVHTAMYAIYTYADKKINFSSHELNFVLLKTSYYGGICSVFVNMKQN